MSPSQTIPKVHKPLPTRVKAAQPESTPLLPPVTNLPTLWTLFAASPRQLFQVFHPEIPPVEAEVPVFLPEEPFVEPEIPPTPILKTLLTAPLRKWLHANFKMLPVDSNAARQPRNLPEDTLLILHIQPSGQYLAKDIITALLQTQFWALMILRWCLTLNSLQRPANLLLNYFQSIPRPSKTVNYYSAFQAHFRLA